MLIDEAVITVRSGKGGAGKVSFYPGKKSGPDGGDGGDGGNVYVEATRQMTSLEYYVSDPKHAAENGQVGQGYRRKGAKGEDLILRFPVGTMLTDIESKKQIELEEEGQCVLVCKGGRGGKGNEAFKSSTNTTPRYAQPGLPGQQRTFKVIMRLIADYGLIGLPNAGKSSLLNALTNASVRTANYPFTTLSPNLGVCNGKILADIPGLIDGASQGKGLGIKFLKHIEKVETLFHCISIESEDPAHDYAIIRSELERFNPHLLGKKEIILLTKCDLIGNNEVRKKKDSLLSLASDVVDVSVIDDDRLQQLIQIL
ncbi:MAG: GTPase ObgE [Patescibacteria group bacterium]